MATQTRAAYEELSDAALAVCMSRREVGAVRLVTRRNNQRLFRTAWSILKNRADAEDAVQEAYVRAFMAIKDFNGRSSLSTWLTRIVINESLMRKRSAKRRASAFDGTSVLVIDEYRQKFMASPERRSSPEAATMRRQLSTLLENAIAQLPEAFRMVFVLREIEELSVDETAEVLQIPAETVKTRLLRARRRLQKLLDPELKSALDDTFVFAGADCEGLTQRVLRRLALTSETNIGGLS